ncbi:MAG: EamA family transporter [Chloroflexi bacterium]|nr:EamA family transporter [Chloroflexota bacterium]MCC6892319.1 EamA family transporter [Anaerolineae bacterium]
MERMTQPRQSQLRGFGLVALGGTLWGTIGPATQAIFSGSAVAPLSVSFFRVAIATPILLVACAWLLGANGFRIGRRDLLIMMLSGILTGLSQTTYLVAIPLAGVTISTLVGVCTAPVSVALFSVIFKFEPFNRTVMIALAFALIGTVLVVGIEPGTTISSDVVLGVLLSVVCGLLYAGAIVCGRLVANRAHSIQVNTVAFATSAVMLLVIGGLTGGLKTDYPVEGWLLLVYLAVVPTVLGYGFFVAGMKTTSATIAGIITLLEPLTAAILAAAFFHERLTLLALVGAVLLLGAILVLARDSSREKGGEEVVVQHS